MNIPNILFDSRSSQVQIHDQTGTRLTDLFNAITSTNNKPAWNYTLSGLPKTPEGEAPSLTSELTNNKSNYNVLCILTRLDQLAPTIAKLGPYPEGSNTPPFFRIFQQNSFCYSPQEIAAIVGFVNGGGVLLLISDHGPAQDLVKDNQTINDCQLAAAFGVAIEPAMFVNPNGLIEMSGSCFNTNYSGNILQNVTSVVVHDCCAIFPFAPNSEIVPIVSLPDGLKNVSPINNIPPPGTNGETLAFALCNSSYKGNIIIAGNSGIAGNADHPYPSQGLFYATPPAPPLQMPYAPLFTAPPLPAAQNSTFLLNCLAFLAVPNG